MSDTCIYCDENCGGDMSAKDPSKEKERLKFFREERNQMHRILFPRGSAVASDTDQFAHHMANWINQWKDVNGERLRLLPVVQAARKVVADMEGKTGLTPEQMALRKAVAEMLAVGPPKWTGET